MKKYEQPKIEVINFDSIINTAAGLSAPNVDVPLPGDWTKNL